MILSHDFVRLLTHTHKSDEDRKQRCECNLGLVFGNTIWRKTRCTCYRNRRLVNTYIVRTTLRKIEWKKSYGFYLLRQLIQLTHSIYPISDDSISFVFHLHDYLVFVWVQQQQYRSQNRKGARERENASQLFFSKRSRAPDWCATRIMMYYSLEISSQVRTSIAHTPSSGSDFRQHKTNLFAITFSRFFRQSNLFKGENQKNDRVDAEIAIEKQLWPI